MFDAPKTRWNPRGIGVGEWDVDNMTKDVEVGVVPEMEECLLHGPLAPLATLESAARGARDATGPMQGFTF